MICALNLLVGVAIGVGLCLVFYFAFRALEDRNRAALYGHFGDVTDENNPHGM